MKWYNSLIFKIILCSAVLIFCLIGSIFGVLYRYQQSILSEMEQKSSQILEKIQFDLTNLETGEIPGDVLESQISDLKDYHGINAVTLYDSEKNIVTSIQSGGEPLLGFGDPEGYVATVPGRKGSKVLRYVQELPIMIGSREAGYLSVRLDIAPQTHLVKALRSKIIIALVLLFLGTLGVLCYFIFKLLHPLHAMAATCHEISEGNLREIDIEPNASEVLILEMKFNEMVNALKLKAEMEQKLTQAQRLSALGNLAAGVAHEIGNPLNGIKLTISHLRDISSRQKLDEASFNKYTDSVLNEVNRLDQIVKDFLMLAKERELSLRPYNMGKLLNETMNLIEKEAQKRGVKIHASIHAPMKETLIDPQLLKSAILNILINAMEASTANKTIHVSLAESDGRIVLEITDEGAGVPREILDQVFDPYFSTKSDGTGLGLPLTRMIIEKHGGEISLKSPNGQGTAVTVTIPMEGV